MVTWCAVYLDENGEMESEEIEVSDSLAKDADDVRRLLEEKRVGDSNLWTGRIVDVKPGPCPER